MSSKLLSALPLLFLSSGSRTEPIEPNLSLFDSSFLCVSCTLRGVRPIIISAERRGKRRASCVPLANEPVR